MRPSVVYKSQISVLEPWDRRRLIAEAGAEQQGIVCAAIEVRC